MSLSEFILPAVTSVSVRSIHLGILTFSLKTIKKKNPKLNQVEHYSHFSILRYVVLKGTGIAKQESKAALFDGISGCDINTHEKS